MAARSSTGIGWSWPPWSGCHMNDPRYGSRWWKRTRLAVLRRDGYQCQVVQGCPRYANHCDHMDPVDERTTDAQFHDQARLRAACMFHNTRRGHVAAFERELEGGGEAPRRGLRFFSGTAEQQRPLANLYTRNAGNRRRALVVADYGRNRTT